MPVVRPSAAAATMAPAIDRFHRTRASGVVEPSAAVRFRRRSASSAGSTMRRAGMQAMRATRPEPRNMTHMLLTPRMAPIRGPTAMPEIWAP